MIDTKRWPSAITIIVALLMLGIGGGLVNSLRHDFTESIGYWGSLVAAGIALATAVFGITLLLQNSSSKRTILALLIPVGVFSFEEIGASLTESLGKFPAEAIGGVVAALICLCILWVLSSFCGIQWNDGHDSEAES